MPRRGPSVVFALVAFVSFACSDDQSSDTDASVTDSAMSLDTGAADAGIPDSAAGDANHVVVTPCDPGAMPIPVAGIGGGPLDGTLQVFVNANGEAALEGARVVVKAGAQTFTATTGADGCVQFNDQSLRSRADVHLFKADHSYASVLGVRSAKVTWPLVPYDIVDMPAEPAIVSGIIEGLQVIGSTTATIAHLALVGAIQPNVFARDPPQRNRTGSSLQTNVVVIGGPGFDYFDYTLRVEPSITALVCYAGRALFLPNNDVAIEYTHYGFLRDLMLSPGQTLDNQNIPITLPADRSITVRYGSTQGLPEVYAAAYVVLGGGEGWIYANGTATTTIATGFFDIDEMPPLAAPIQDATYGAAVQAQSEDAFSIVIQPGTRAGVIDVGNLPVPPADLSASGHSISTVLADADPFAEIYVSRDGRLVWWVMVANPVPGLIIDLPPPPGGLTDPLSGMLNVGVASYSMEGVAPSDFSFDGNIDAKIRRFSGITKDLPF